VNINPYTFRNNKSDCIFCYRDKVKNKTKESFEKLVIKRKWSFSSNYEFISNEKKVLLICDNQHEIYIIPVNFSTIKIMLENYLKKQSENEVGN
jgi:hypothetical protein